MSDTLEFAATLDRTQVPPKAPAELKCQLAIAAPEALAPTSKSDEPQMTSNVCLVFDCSGSMAGEKRETAIDAAKMIVDTIHERHRLSLVGFATTSSVMVDNAQATTAEEREKIKKRIEQRIRDFPRGTTNLADGLKKALRVITKEKADAMVAIVLSDGGADSARDALDAGRKVTEAGVQIFAVGIGEDYVAEQLLELVTPSNGAVYGGSDLERVKSTFGALIGRIESFVATHAQIEIAFAKDVVPGQAYKTAPEQAFIGALKPDDERVATLHVGNVEGGQTYSFLVSMTAPARDGGKLEIARATLRYDAAGRKRKGETVTVPIEVAFAKGAAEADAEVAAAFRGAQVSEMVQQLGDAIRRKDSGRATEILDELIARAEGDGERIALYEELRADLKSKGTISQAKLNALVLGSASRIVRTAKPKVGKLYDVVLADPGKKLITVIREIREMTGLQLAEVNSRVQRAPAAIQEALTLADARASKKRLETLGARVAVKPREGG